MKDNLSIKLLLFLNNSYLGGNKGKNIIIQTIYDKNILNGIFLNYI